ncbi:MAG: potassium channel family protein [Chloroflexota bacterium]|nr:potassium channel family protein [Chloroflexota bacterium]
MVVPVPRALSDAASSDVAERVQELLEQARRPQTLEHRQALLDESIALHRQLEGVDQHGAQQAEMAFILLLRDEPIILENRQYRQFVTGCLGRETLYRIPWQSIEEVIAVVEVLLAFRFQDEISAKQLTGHVRDLVRHALCQFEREDELAKMFELFQRAPIPVMLLDAELVRLRNRLHLYEARRVRHKKRFLYAYLALQVLLIFLIFPLLFQNSENGQIQRQVQQTTGLEVVKGEIVCADTEEGRECKIPRQFLDFDDCLYWSVITWGSIGYGDITPVTQVGRRLAEIHGLMGVITGGVIAGLVLSWISPRTLNET